MNRRKLNWGLLGLALAATQPGSAYAWESDKVNRAHNPTIGQPPINPIVPPDDPHTQVDNRRFGMRIMRQAIGTFDPSGQDDPVLPALLVCPEEAIADRDLSNCRAARPNDLGARGYQGWITARSAWSNEEHGEHYIVSRLAAQAAGLLGHTSLFDRFWIRYPTKDELVGSKLFEKLPEGSPIPFVLGQSLKPSPWSEVEAHALRGISLLELAQLPDFSNSAADWIRGNETCPIEGLEGAFREHEVAACHSFSLVMGAVNVTHFAPLNREMHRYYHALAKQRMVRCARLLPLIDPFYVTYNDPETSYSKPWSIHDTEAHECEREAFMYEMVAQHFLQDAWSSGHMWKRWGYPRFTEGTADSPGFLPDVVLPSDTSPPPILEANRAGRRAALALSLGAIAGTLHGAKAITYGLVRDTHPFGHPLAELLDQNGVLNDPLSGPKYTLPGGWLFGGQHLTSWRAGGEHFPGAGDMFWDPPAPHANVSQDAEYAEQRKRFIDCAAASMRDVYRTGDENGVAVTRANGAAGPPTNDDIDFTDPVSDYCWDHWATNESMLGSLGALDVLNLVYPLGTGLLSDAAGALGAAMAANGIVIVARLGAVNLPASGEAPQSDDDRDRIKDRNRFLIRLLERSARDMAGVGDAYLENARNDPNGTESARGQIGNGLISMLGVPPISDASIPPPERPRAVDYVDRPALDESLRLAFWRSHLVETCAASAADQAQVINDLRDRCRNASASGGDPDACTACVDLAEVHIPTCSRVLPAVGESKCSALGSYDSSSPPEGLPSWWFDHSLRRLEAGSVLDTDGTPSDIINCGYPSYQVAFHWCTGTPSDQFTRGSLIGYNRLSKQETAVIDCGPGTQDDRHYEKGTERVAVGLAEVALSGEAKPFLRPMITSFEQGYEYVPSPEPCSFEPYVLTTTLDARAAQAASPAHLWDNQAWGSRELQQGYEALKVPQCGQYQRMSWWNRDCATARPELLLLGGPPPDGWNPATGRYESGDEDSCLIREARCFGNRCADGRVAWLPNGCPDSMSCNAGGWCVPESTNPFRPVVLLEPGG